jgi:hypothetical protein
VAGVASRRCPHYPQRKKSHGVRSGDLGGQLLKDFFLRGYSYFDGGLIYSCLTLDLNANRYITPMTLNHISARMTKGMMTS